ncbi:MAG: hypothetical protein ACYCV0_15925, partial [Desulfitobacteriaceae bacterium]
FPWLGEGYVLVPLSINTMSVANVTANINASNTLIGLMKRSKQDTLRFTLFCRFFFHWNNN